MNVRSPLLIASLSLTLGACSSMSEGQRAAAIGAGIGTVVGAGATSAISKGDGKMTRKGAVAGAAIGALSGYIWSNRMQVQKEKLEQATAGTGVEVSQTADNRIKLDVPADISFDINRAAIKPDFQQVLDQFAQTLRTHNDTQIDIIGHTDSTGSANVNAPLSVNRAASTRDYLANRGVSFNRMAVAGRGADEPIASNRSSQGRAKNRRVEIYIAENAPQ